MTGRFRGGPPGILFAAGGTGGHVRPALAVAHALRETAGEEVPLRFLSAGRPRAEAALADVCHPVTPLFPRLGERAPRRSEAWVHLSALARARRLLRREEAAVLVGFGGYVTAVAAAAALSLGGRRPLLFLAEQNAVPGRAVRWFARAAEEVFVPFPGVVSRLPRGAAARVTGTPIDPAFCALEPPRSDGGAVRILALGGSQGARDLNRLLLSVLPALLRERPRTTAVIVTGPAHFGECRRSLESAGAVAARIELRPYVKRPESLVERADLVVARAGGTTLAELLAAGRPMVLMPYPFAVDDHQRANAKTAREAGAAWVVEQEEGADALAGALSRLLDDGAERARMARAAARLGRPAAAREVADALLEAIARVRRGP